MCLYEYYDHLKLKTDKDIKIIVSTGPSLVF